MNKTTLTLYILCLSILTQPLSFAQASYVQKGSIGTQSKPVTPKADFLYTKHEYWKGLQVVFLPVRPYKVAIEPAYQNFIKGEMYSYTGEHPSYEEIEGKTATVLDVKKQDTGWMLIFKVDETGMILCAQVSGVLGQLDGVVLKRDLDKARAKYLGKIVYPKITELNTYNEAKDEENTFTVKKYAALQVKNIVAGFDVEKPVRFILSSTNGKVGYVDLNLSGTNLYDFDNKKYAFDKSFLMTDPRLTYKWSLSIWKAIENEEVMLGMTRQQAVMSWGEPDEINETLGSYSTHEQWVYKDEGYLYFQNGRLTTIQD